MSNNSELNEINMVFDQITRKGTVDIPIINDHLKSIILKNIAANTGSNIRSWEQVLSIYAKNHLIYK